MESLLRRRRRRSDIHWKSDHWDHWAIVNDTNTIVLRRNEKLRVKPEAEIVYPES